MLHISKNSDKTHFGKWLSVRRQKYGLSQESIAERLHCKRQTICNHESGKVKPSYVFCLGYAMIFDEDVDYLWLIVNLD